MLTRNLQNKQITISDEFTLLEDRKDWKPSDIPKEPLNLDDNCYLETLKKCVALSLNLELPVGAFIRHLLDEEKNLPPTAFNGLLLNIQDEEKHQIAFEKIAIHYTPTPEMLYQANEFRKIITKLKINPLIKARDLETCLFIPVQTYMRFVGGETLERTIADVSHDEYRHLNYNWAVSEMLKLDIIIEFIEQLAYICRWVFSDLPGGLMTDPTTHNFWNEALFQMAEQGESKNLSGIMNYGIHKAPFEISNSYY